MVLWIRSQDKETLIKIEHLDIYGGGECWTIEECGVDLGEYKTKERALRVLGEIQKYILLPNTDGSAYVYQMPEE